VCKVILYYLSLKVPLRRVVSDVTKYALPQPKTHGHVKECRSLRYAATYLDPLRARITGAPCARLLKPREDLAVERAERTPSIVAVERIVTALETTLAEMFADLEACRNAASPVRPRLVPFPLDGQQVRVPPGEEDP
jgi:hypothetical protein